MSITKVVCSILAVDISQLECAWIIYLFVYFSSRGPQKNFNPLMQQLDTTEKFAYTEKSVPIPQLDRRGEEVCNVQMDEVSKHCECAGSSNF